MTSGLAIAILVGVALLLQIVWGAVVNKRARKAEEVFQDVSALGDDLVPASLYPKVNADLCIGSGACVHGCPEHDVIGLVAGKVKLVNPLACVGHGACAAACPVDAIDLVFGTVKRGVELPLINETFETNLPGVYIVGELGGMGLIRNAIAQGRQAGGYIAKSGRRGQGDVLDAVVVGAGPGGISATLQLIQEGYRTVLLERETFGGTIVHYPRAKVVMTGKLEVPGYGSVRKRTMSKEKLLELWEDIRAKTDLPVRTGELVESLDPAGDGNWIVKSTSGKFHAANVVLALGRRGSPRKLGVPGEDLEKVCYRLLEPEPFEGKHVLVVGGGNAAAECALALADYGGCASVGISYRRDEFARLRAQVRERISAEIAAGRVTGHLPTQVSKVGATDISLTKKGSEYTIPNDAVIVQIGGTPPSALLSKFGIEMVEKHAER